MIWAMHSDTLKEYNLGVLSFGQMNEKEKSNYINNVKLSNKTIKSSASINLNTINSIYGAIKDENSVSFKDGKIVGVNDNFISKIKKELGEEYLSLIENIFHEDDNELQNMLYVVKGGVAHIPIVGVLRRGRVIDSTYWKWGYSSTYNEIIVASQLADLDDRVESITYDINTPGGSVDGVAQAADAIKAVKKPTVGRVHFWAMSAGWLLLSQTNNPVGVNDMVQVGSQGVVYEFYDWSEYEKKLGVKKHTITSKNAPLKRPKGKELDAQIQKSADEFEEIFISRVAAGRGVSYEYASEKFGRGGDLIALDALKVGMIVEIENGVNVEKDIEITDSEGDSMDLKELQKKYPDACNQVREEGKAEGFEAGKAAAIANASQHIKFVGKAKNETIFENIKTGVEFGADTMTKYMEENEARVMKANRETDDDGHESTSTEKPEDTKDGGDANKPEEVTPEAVEEAFERMT